MKKVYTSITVDGLTLSKEELQSHPTMVISSHRSHLDYMLLGVVLHQAGLPNIRMAAGDNLTTIPFLGKKFLSWGAFSVHRSRSGSRKYLMELCNTVTNMLDDDDNILVFPEGGRSYTGKMMSLKNGILAANIFAQFRSPNKKFTYLPVTLSYEKTPELDHFDMLNKGRHLKGGKASFFNGLKGSAFYYGADILAFIKFVTAHRFKRSYGDVFVDFGEPIVINDLLDLEKNFSPRARNDFAAHKESIQTISDLLGKELYKIYRIHTLHIVSAILKKCGSCTRNHAESLVPDILKSLEKQNRNCSMLQSLSEGDIVQKGVDKLIYFNVISEKGKKLRIKNRGALKYYAATIGKI
jgi:1-acyl-sn-glycerol-3-phosphate acyltransferase